MKDVFRDILETIKFPPFNASDYYETAMEKEEDIRKSMLSIANYFLTRIREPQKTVLVLYCDDFRNIREAHFLPIKGSNYGLELTEINFIKLTARKYSAYEIFLLLFTENKSIKHNNCERPTFPFSNVYQISSDDSTQISQYHKFTTGPLKKIINQDLEEKRQREKANTEKNRQINAINKQMEVYMSGKWLGQWEYKCVGISDEPGHKEQRDARLKEAGLQGWELAGVIPEIWSGGSSSHHNNSGTCIFKRPLIVNPSQEKKQTPPPAQNDMEEIPF